MRETQAMEFDCCHVVRVFRDRLNGNLSSQLPARQPQDSAPATRHPPAASRLKPSCTTLPRSRMIARSVTPSTFCACCSTISAASPSSRTNRRSTASNSSTMIGARPSVGSSSNSRRGLSINARPIAAASAARRRITWLPMLRRRSASRGNIANTRATSHGPVPAAPPRSGFPRLLGERKIVLFLRVTPAPMPAERRAARAAIPLMSRPPRKDRAADTPGQAG